MRHPVLAYDPRHALNAVCPYFTMFPLEYPLKILRRKQVSTRVLDPFCGRGTSLYAARWLGIDSWGLDTSPVAVAIAQAKLAAVDVMEALELAYEILDSQSRPAIPSGEFWSCAFHPTTLHDICALREGLLKRRTEAATLLRAIILGCLHGPLRSDSGEASYLSNQMPRTFAPKPAYAVTYWRRLKLKPPHVDTVGVITKKALRLPTTDLLRTSPTSQVRRGDSQTASAFTGLPNDFDTVITSPPYYGMVNYVQDQWLRHWFLGGPEAIDYHRTQQLKSAGPVGFAQSLAKVWDNVGDRLAENGRIFVRFGAIRSRQIDPRELLRKSFALSQHRWHIVSARNARSASAGKRQAHQMRLKTQALNECDMHVRFA